MAGLYLFASWSFWVWPLMIPMAWIGWRARVAQEVPIAVCILIPLFGLLSLNTASGLPVPYIAWLVLTVSFVSAVISGFEFQTPLISAKGAGRVRMRGDLIVLAALMVIFWAKIIQVGVLVWAPGLAMTAAFNFVVAGATGLASGDLAGRALSVVWWQPRPSAPQAPPDHLPGNRR